MVSNASVCDYFRGVDTPTRIELMCTLLKACMPLELRLLGTCLEEIASKDYAHLREFESKANSERDARVLSDKVDDKSRGVFVAFLCLLHANNQTCSTIMYTALNNMVRLAKAKPTSDSSASEDLRLLLTIAIHHPAFSFHHKRKLMEHFGWVKDQVPTEGNSAETTQLKTCSDSIKSISVLDCSRTPNGEVVVSMEVLWKECGKTNVRKSWEEINEFHAKLMQLFPGDAKAHKLNKKVPSLALKGMRSAQCATLDSSQLVRSYRASLESYFKDFPTMPSDMLNSDHVLRFFLSSCSSVQSDSQTSQSSTNSCSRFMSARGNGLAEGRSRGKGRGVSADRSSSAALTLQLPVVTGGSHAQPAGHYSSRLQSGPLLPGPLLPVPNSGSGGIISNHAGANSAVSGRAAVSNGLTGLCNVGSSVENARTSKNIGFVSNVMARTAAPVNAHSSGGVLVGNGEVSPKGCPLLGPPQLNDLHAFPLPPSSSDNGEVGSSARAVVRDRSVEEGGVPDIAVWLKEIRLHKYISNLQHLDWEQLQSLQQEDFAKVGLVDGACRKIIQGIQRVRTNGYVPGVENQSPQRSPTYSLPKSPRHGFSINQSVSPSGSPPALSPRGRLRPPPASTSTPPTPTPGTPQAVRGGFCGAVICGGSGDSCGSDPSSPQTIIVSPSRHGSRTRHSSGGSRSRRSWQSLDLSSDSKDNSNNSINSGLGTQELSPRQSIVPLDPTLMSPRNHPASSNHHHPTPTTIASPIPQSNHLAPIQLPQYPSPPQLDHLVRIGAVSPAGGTVAQSTHLGGATNVPVGFSTPGRAPACAAGTDSTPIPYISQIGPIYAAPREGTGKAPAPGSAAGSTQANLPLSGSSATPSASKSVVSSATVVLTGSLSGPRLAQREHMVESGLTSEHGGTLSADSIAPSVGQRADAVRANGPVSASGSVAGGHNVNSTLECEPAASTPLEATSTLPPRSTASAPAASIPTERVTPRDYNGPVFTDGWVDPFNPMMLDPHGHLKQYPQHLLFHQPHLPKQFPQPPPPPSNQHIMMRSDPSLALARDQLPPPPLEYYGHGKQHSMGAYPPGHDGGPVPPQVPRRAVSLTRERAGSVESHHPPPPRPGSGVAMGRNGLPADPSCVKTLMGQPILSNGVVDGSGSLLAEVPGTPASSAANNQPTLVFSHSAAEHKFCKCPQCMEGGSLGGGAGGGPPYFVMTAPPHPSYYRPMFPQGLPPPLNGLPGNMMNPPPIAPLGSRLGGQGTYDGRMGRQQSMPNGTLSHSQHLPTSLSQEVFYAPHHGGGATYVLGPHGVPYHPPMGQHHGPHAPHMGPSGHYYQPFPMYHHVPRRFECYNCGQPGHKAANCKEPPADSGNFRLSYDLRSDQEGNQSRTSSRSVETTVSSGAK